MFLGRKLIGKHSSHEGLLGTESPPSQATTTSFPEQPGTSVTVTATITTRAVDDDGNWVSSPKDTVFPETIPEESSSTEEEHVVIFRLPSLHESDGFLRDPSIYTAETSLFQLAMTKNGTGKSNLKVESVTAISVSDTKQVRTKPTMQKIGSSTDKDSLDSSKQTASADSQCADGPGSLKTSMICQHFTDICAATFMDVAVLRSLFILDWQEEGVYWGLLFIYNRLRDISEENIAQQQPRRRSNSLPIPKIEVSVYQSPETKKRESKDFIEVPEVKDVSLRTESPYHAQKRPEETRVHLRRASEKTKKRMKMADLKAFVETKLLSKSDKALEKIGHYDPKPLSDQIEYHRSLDTGDEHLSRPSSALSKMFGPLHHQDPTSNLIKGKSMPSLRYIGESNSDRRRQSRICPPNTLPTPNPIITVTEHTPTPSPDYMKRHGSVDSQLDAGSASGSKSGQPQERKSSLTRSQTDSNITYTGEEIPEAPGSACYITREGNIDYQVVLKATHTIALRDSNCCTMRVLEVVLNLVELLMDVGVLKQCLRDEAVSGQTTAESPDGNKTGKTKETPAQTPSSPAAEKGTNAQEQASNTHRLIMDIIIRVLKHLGCPHGCGDGQRGPPAEFLRTQCQNILAKLNRASNKQFASYLKDYVRYHTIPDILDLFHAYVGFCIDPSSLLSPLNQKRGSSKSPDIVSQGGYATNFGTGLGGGGIRGVEGQVISYVFKALVTRFVNSIKEIKLQENLAIYCEIRQLMTYIKEGHGGTFRRVALSALLDTANRPNKKEANMQTTRVIRHMHQSEMEEQTEVATDPSYVMDDRGNRKLLFKKRSTSSTCASLLETEVEEASKASQSPLGNIRKKHHILTPRQSERTLGIVEATTSKSKSKSRLGGIVNWFKRDGSNSESNDNYDNTDLSSDTSAFIRQPSLYHPTSKLTHKSSSSNMGNTLQKAKKRVEDRFTKFVLKKGKKKDGSMEETQGSYFSRKNSLELGETSRENEFVVLKERRLVATLPVFNGMLRFSFMLETCQPGSVPDPHLLAAVLDLPHTAVVARAALIVECSYFVHCCNKGQWPAWMKLNFPMFRPSGPMPHRGPTTGLRRTHIMQRAAGKMFYQWAEALGTRLEEMIVEDKQNESLITSMVTDEAMQKELLVQDDEEDFLDEASINGFGSNCPLALRLIACNLLLEITAFLRETYQNLPKSSRLSGRERPPPWERMYSKEANRRWSMALSSMGHSQTSAQSLQSIAGDRDAVQAERKISFVLHEPDNESEGSSNTTVTMQGDEGQPNDKSKRVMPPSRSYLLRRGTSGTATGGSFKRRSLKLRRGTKEGKDMEIEYPVKRADSIQSKRKVSSLSDRSDTSEPGVAGEVSGEESPGILSDDQPPESPSDSNDTDDTTKHMPWMKTVVLIANSFNYVCSHQQFCHPYCYRRHMRGCSRLIKAIRKVYGEEFGVVEEKLEMGLDNKPRDEPKKDKSRNRKVSDQTSSQVSPIRRKDSVGKRDRIDKNIDDLQMGRTIGSKESSRDIADSENDKLKENGKPKTSESRPKELPSILKYIKTQIRDGFHAPLAVLVKGAVILSEEHFIDIMPVAWELLLEWNQEVAASAASLFILAAVRAPHQVVELMQQGLKHQDPAIRINAILRFQVLWKLRYQVWPRMEEGAQLTFKVPPPGIEFTLPSPKIGIESLPVVDPPWMPQVKTKVEEVTINQERHRSLVTATKTRKKQQTELIKMALQAQDDKKREERENFLITTIPITVQAGYEPSLYHAAGDDHDEAVGDEEQGDGQLRNTSHHLHSAHSLFPSQLCSAVIQIVNMLDDAAVAGDGNAVYEVAYQVIWNCLVEDSALFLRYVLERLTREKQEQMFKILRHLIRFVPKLPQQAAFALYNYIIGYVMFYTRSPHEEGQKLIGTALSLLWMVVHSVHGIMFKDLKQILRKEQCDASILLTANVPSAKKIIVHGPQELDAGGIPSQFPVQEDTQFCQILRESLDFFGVDESRHKEYFLVDYKTHQIHNSSSYVRDYYFFKRSQYPQLELVHLKPEDAFNALQKQELLHKFVEIGKVLLTWAILKNVDMVVQRVVFLHEELMKLPSFPRKALESNLDLYKGGELGKELLGLDVLHKFMWVRLIARMFEAMAGNFAYSGDIHLFLNVLNGAVILHSEDALILRYVMATYINAAFNFKNIFSTNGYLLIMPTLLKIYSNHQSNKLITTTVEYAVKQFYLMNRKPFILQMFGSVSAVLDTDEEGTYGDAHKVQSSCLFNLLLSLETPSPDPLNISELVKEDKPLKAIDFCYHDENEMVTVLDCISLCVMVVSYASESVRGYQMLIILEAILPCYLQHIQLPTYNKEGKTEKEIIHQLAVAIKTLVNNCEALTKSYNGPYRSSPEHKGSSQRNYSRGPYSPGFDFEDESHSKYMSEHSRAKSMYEHDVEDSEMLRAEYRRPRDVLLSLVGDFMYRANTRLIELNRKANQEGKIVDLLDIRSHVRLADIAHSLLKVSPYDPESMACRGLQLYMSHILPSTEWANDAMRPALVTILRRLDKVFNKISKKPSIRRNTDWDAAAGLLKGIFESMLRYPYIMHWQYIKVLINTCQTLIDHYNLEQVCGGSSVFSSQEKAENMIMNLIVPLCLRVGSGRKDVAQMRQSDISFALTVVLHAMSPPTTKTAPVTAQNLKTVSEMRTGSLTYTSRDTKVSTKINTSLYQVSFLALKIMTVCFESDLITDWPRIARTMRELGKRNEAANYLWDFLEFVVTQRTPLYILMQPFIFQKLTQPPISDHERHMQSLIRDKMRGINLPQQKCRGAILMELAHEIKELKEELEETSSEEKIDPIRKTEMPQTAVQVTSEVNHGRHQRPSLIEFLTGDLGSNKSQGSAPPSQTGSQGQNSQEQQRESLSSASVASTINQGHASTSDCGQENGANGSSTPCNVPTDRSQQSSVSDEHCLPTQKSETCMSQQKTPKLRFVSSVELRHSSGETSTTPLSPGSPADDSSSEIHPNKPRLQRVKAQSRKTFRLRKSRKSRIEVSHIKLDPQELPTIIPQQQQQSQQQQPVHQQTATSTPVRACSQPVMELSVAGIPAERSRLFIHSRTADGSWDEDSVISQTSSTSGYRESYSLQCTMDSPRMFPPLASPDLHDLPSTSSATTNNYLACDNSSPDCSFNENGERTALLSRNERSSSQHSLLMVFDTQDETTLI
ncbi:uncoordinated 80 [Carabus blaptoides fortunei]